MIITGTPMGTFKAAPVASYKDHRIAMMLCVASLLIDEPLLIKDVEAMAHFVSRIFRSLKSFIR